MLLQRGPLGVMIQYLPFSLTISTPLMVALSRPFPDATNERFAKRQGRSFVTCTSQSSSASRFTARHDLFVHIPKGLGTAAEVPDVGEASPSLASSWRSIHSICSASSSQPRATSLNALLTCGLFVCVARFFASAALCRYMSERGDMQGRRA